MNWDRVEGNWEKVKGQIRQKWGKLTEDDLEQARGRRRELVGRIQQRYGQKKDEVERDVDRFISNI